MIGETVRIRGPSSWLLSAESWTSTLISLFTSYSVFNYAANSINSQLPNTQRSLSSFHNYHLAQITINSLFIFLILKNKIQLFVIFLPRLLTGFSLHLKVIKPSHILLASFLRMTNYEATIPSSSSQAPSTTISCSQTFVTTFLFAWAALSLNMFIVYSCTLCRSLWRGQENHSLL